MTIDREIILDLMPLYRAGLASGPSRRLVEAWLAEHPADRTWSGSAPADAQESEGFAAFARARRLRRWLRRLYGIACALTAISLTTQLHFAGGRLEWARLVAIDHPLAFAPAVLGAAAAWTAYFELRRRLR
ncbi:MAG: hypothetical protein JO276_07390 [Sphingomonadaceae bacterium]|nr:hypothetical protein [Sphingomonadaceae bacterium]